MYTTVKGKTVWVYNDKGISIRMIPVTSEVEQAYVSGENIVVVTADGFTSLYNKAGQRIRHTQA